MRTAHPPQAAKPPADAASAADDALRAALFLLDFENPEPEQIDWVLESALRVPA